MLSLTLSNLGTIGRRCVRDRDVQRVSRRQASRLRSLEHVLGAVFIARSKAQNSVLLLWSSLKKNTFCCVSFLFFFLERSVDLLVRCDEQGRRSKKSLFRIFWNEI